MGSTDRIEGVLRFHIAWKQRNQKEWRHVYSSQTLEVRPLSQNLREKY